MVEDELEGLALARRERRERREERPPGLAPRDELLRVLERLPPPALVPREAQREQLAHEAPAAPVGRGVSDEGEEPGAEGRLAAVPGLALEDLHVDGLEDLLGLGRVAPTAGERPAEGGRVARLELLGHLRGEFGVFHAALRSSAT